MMNGVGAHEVIIESPDPNARFHEFSRDHIMQILRMYRDRVSDLTNDDRFRYIQVFRNYGEAAGANIPHPHSQVFALPILPRWVREEIQQGLEYWNLKERCIFCDITSQDENGPRMVTASDHFVALAPFASKFPFETWIYPREHAAYFHQTPDEKLEDLARILKRTLTALALAINDPPYNLIIHSAPQNPEKAYHTRGARVQDYYHWHIEIIPRATKVAGFEYGTGFYINSVMPEKGAEYLRSILHEATEHRTGGGTP
jgi:UDPglucose--hexose-1-phosphate uridylyltransferase